MILFVNLFFISGFGRTLTIPGLLVIYSLIGIIDGMIIRKEYLQFELDYMKKKLIMVLNLNKFN